MKKSTILVYVLALLMIPVSAFAQQLTDIDSVATKATNIGNLVIGLTISLAVIWIIVNVVRYLVVSGEDARKAGGMAILYGVIALFVILSIWGLVAILRNSFRTQDNVPTSDINRTTTLLPPRSTGGSGGGSYGNSYYGGYSNNGFTGNTGAPSGIQNTTSNGTIRNDFKDASAGTI